MRQSLTSAATPAIEKANWLVWVGVTVGLAAIYATVFALTEILTAPADLGLWALCNAIPHVLLSMPLVDRVGTRLVREPLGRALWIGASCAAIYVAAAYASTIFLLALTARVEAEGIWVRFFQGPALSWQIFQGLAYAALALTVGMLVATRRELEALQGLKPATPQLQHWLVKTAEGIVPIDPQDLIRIEADGEYSRLVMPGRNVLSRIALGECERRVQGLPFLRVHRSHLVNADAITKAEPAGNGRIQLSLRNGEHVVTSREGARVVRASSI